MGSIYSKTDNNSIITRINLLKPDSKALWGKMTVDQMCKHCNEAIIVAFGENEIKVPFFFKLIGKLLKNKILNSEFKPNSPTAKELIYTGQYDFEDVKNELIKNFSRFSEGQHVITLMDHPLWGKMTYEDWNKLMWNHINHHLKQFNV
ncbi:DUF1569 domain-containing protein [Flavobacterium adhaerens]|uniref:DUF1569 domain-containing protein n=1 Tax=Flavobacterium adhaerens TaxID=3149043 RepID=UPI0032B3FB1A